VDTDGKTHRFVRDIIRRGPTVVSFTYLGCASICPAVDLTIDEAVRKLAESAGPQPHFLTITIDPINDTPSKLAERAQAMERTRRFVSGEPLDVISVLDGLGMQFDRIEDHALFVLAIGEGGRKVEKASGLASAEQVAAAIARVR